MKEPYSEVLARHAGPESYAGGGNATGVATTGVHLGPEIESRKMHRPVCRPAPARGRQHRVDRYGKGDWGHGGACGPRHGWKLQAREPGDPGSSSEEVADDGSETSQRVQRT
jgi:hypothetical protein